MEAANNSSCFLNLGETIPFVGNATQPGEARPRCLETAGWTLLVSPGSFWNVLSGHMLQMLVREAHAWNGILIIVGMRRILFRTAAEKA